MQVHTFIAESAADAVAQIRETLGQDAVVLNVRRAEPQGFSRLWQKPRIEVLAHVPEKTAPAAPTEASNTLAMAELREELRQLRETIHAPGKTNVSADESDRKSEPTHVGCYDSETQDARGVTRPTTDGGWRIGTLLEQSGVLPLYAGRIVEELRRTHGEFPPEQLRHEIQMARVVLENLWRPAMGGDSGVHVFIGAPGCGKTTALCKWLAQSSLVEGKSCAVWRLDGHVSNTAESLSVFCEILGVPVERFVARGGRKPDADLLFIDLPGVNPNDAQSMNGLARQLSQLPGATVHLVVNGAYESALMMAQARAFEALGVNDVIVTHLDEETRWGKLWNLTLGTNCSVRFLSAGQNIPGDFTAASPANILARQFPRNPRISQTQSRMADALLNRE